MDRIHRRLPGRWRSSIAPANGTEEFHSEAADPAAPRAGSFSAANGHWKIQASNGYTDGGTYRVQSSGIWRLLPNGDDDP